MEKLVDQKKTLVLVMEVSSFVLFLAKLKSLAKNMCSKNRECRVMATVERFVPTTIKTPLLLHGMAVKLFSPGGGVRTAGTGYHVTKTPRVRIARD